MRMALKPNISVRFYRRRNRLREKTAGLGPNEGVTISPGALVAAERARAELAEGYPEWAGSLIEQLAWQYRKCLDRPEQRPGCLAEIKAIARGMQGHGNMFGYPLISTFADSLHGFCDHSAPVGDGHLELIKAHVDAMRAVIAHRISGDGGQVGRQLTTSLEEAIAKLRRAPA